jgi:hypothetical protein
MMVAFRRGRKVKLGRERSCHGSMYVVHTILKMMQVAQAQREGL